MEGRSGTADVAGTRLWYEVAGRGPPIVLVHGFALDARMWDEQVGALAKSHQVIRYDMRGFGRSALPDQTSYSASADLKALLDQLRCGPAAIVGLSMGGGVALDFALAHPASVRALVLVDSVVGGWPWSSAWSAQAGPVWSDARKLGIDAARARWLGLSLFAPAREQPAVERRLIQMVSDYSGWHWVHDDPQEYPNPPAMQHLGSVNSPALIVVGERDVPDFQAIADTLRHELPHAEKVTLPGVGHMANMEDPDGFNGVAVDFLARHV